MAAKNKTRKKAIKTAVGLGATAVLAVVCPPAALGAAAAVALGSARRFAQSGDPQDAKGMVTGFDDLSDSLGDDR